MKSTELIKLTKRLTEKQKEEIVESFESGLSIDFLSQKYNFSSSTIIRNLKKNFGELKYKELFKNSKYLKAETKLIRIQKRTLMIPLL